MGMTEEGTARTGGRIGGGSGEYGSEEKRRTSPIDNGLSVPRRRNLRKIRRKGGEKRREEGPGSCLQRRSRYGKKVTVKRSGSLGMASAITQERKSHTGVA